MANKTNNGYEYQYNGIDVCITSNNLTDEIVEYANKLVDYYINNKDEVSNHIYNKFKEQEWQVNKHSKEEIIELIGVPAIHVANVNYGSLVYLNSKLDEHLITVDVFKEFMLGSISVDG